MHWPRDLDGWPLRAASTRVAGPVHRWHVQIMGDGPDLLLLHGAGGSTHSWRDVTPILAQTHRVIALDLPGHGFTTLGLRNRSGLAPMAQDIGSLVQAQGWDPVALIGHSAGTAIALQMTQAGPLAGRPVIGINAALGAFPGLAGVVFPILAQVMSATPFLPRLVARQVGQERQIARLVESTGSTLDDTGRALYRRLAADPDHIAGTLRMMAQWDLTELRAGLAEHPSRAAFLVGGEDTTVPPKVSREAAQMMQTAQVHMFDTLGHLAHEEAPDDVTQVILEELPSQTA